MNDDETTRIDPRLANLRRNPPGVPPANIPPEKRGKHGPSLTRLLKTALKQSPQELCEKFGIPVPDRFRGNTYAARKHLIASLVLRALAGKSDAIELIFDRVEGKANQNIIIGDGGPGGMVPMSEIPADLRIEFARQMIIDAEAEIARAIEGAKDITPEGSDEEKEAITFAGEAQGAIDDAEGTVFISPAGQNPERDVTGGEEPGREMGTVAGENQTGNGEVTNESEAQ